MDKAVRPRVLVESRGLHRYNQTQSAGCDRSDTGKSRQTDRLEDTTQAIRGGKETFADRLRDRGDHSGLIDMENARTNEGQRRHTGALDGPEAFKDLRSTIGLLQSLASASSNRRAERYARRVPMPGGPMGAARTCALRS